MTVKRLLQIAQQLNERYPDAELVLSTDGNLAITLSEHEFVGYINTDTGELVIFEGQE